jgi:two-component system, OmpR family, phosphate regulon response regulator PhoB
VARILLIDDDVALARELLRLLSAEKHEPEHARDGASGIRMATASPPDLVLLEHSLPDISGIDVLAQLTSTAATRHVPVVFLTKESAEIYRIFAFERGAADYVAKPFSARELLLRIRAILRRASMPLRVTEDVHGVLGIDRAARRVRVQGQEIALTRIEYDLLAALIDAEERVETRGELLRRAWGPAANVTERTIDTHMTRLRNKLGPAAAYLQTVRGRGYRFSASAEPR